MTTDPEDHSAGPGPDCRPILRPRCAGDRGPAADLRRVARRGPRGRRGDDRPGRRPGDRVAIWSPNTWHWVVACLATHLCGRRRRPPEHPIHRGRGRRRPGPHRCAAAGGGRRVPRRGQGRRPGSRCPARPAAHRARPDRQGRRDLGRVRRAGYRSRRRGARARRGAARRRLRHPVHLRHHRPQQGRAVRAPAVARRVRGVGGVRAGDQRRPLPLHQSVLPQLRLQGRHPGMPADRGDADPAADVRSGAGDGRGGRSTASPCCPARRRSIRRCSTTPGAATTT